MWKYWQSFRFLFVIAVCTVQLSCGVQQYPIGLNSDWQEQEKKPDSDTLFRNFHGLITEHNSAVLEGEFVNIIIINIEADADNAGFRRVRREYSDRASLLRENDSSLPFPNRIWRESLTINDTLEQHMMMYAYPSPESGIQLARAFYYRPSRDDYVLKLISRISRNGLPDYIFTDISASNISFIGRDIDLGELCQWRNAHSIECPGRGRINWSIYNTAAEAEEALKIQIAYSKSYKFSKLIDEEIVPVNFESVAVKAHRLIFKLRALNFLTSNENAIIVYYLTAKVRGRHVHAVLSYHKSEAIPGRLPSLLQKVMEIEE